MFTIKFFHKTVFAIIISYCFIAGTANARGIIQGAAIQKITTSGSSAYLINTGVSSSAVSGESRPSCATNKNSMSMPVEDKANLALLLTAYASGKNVKLVGSGSCDEVSNIESIGFIQIS